MFALACVVLALGSPNLVVLAVLFAAVGVSTGMVETAQSAHAGELLDPAVRGRGFGLLGLVEGICDLASSVVVGLLFTFASPAWGFAYAGALATLGAIVLVTERVGTAR